MNRYETQISQTIKTEVLVVGSGSAGSNAATASDLEGKKAVLVE